MGGRGLPQGPARPGSSPTAGCSGSGLSTQAVHKTWSWIRRGCGRRSIQAEGLLEPSFKSTPAAPVGAAAGACCHARQSYRVEAETLKLLLPPLLEPLPTTASQHCVQCQIQALPGETSGCKTRAPGTPGFVGARFLISSSKWAPPPRSQ